MVNQRSFFDCPTVSVIPSNNNNNPIINTETTTTTWTPPPAIPSGFELISNKTSSTSLNCHHQYKMITFALGKIFCYSCIGNITSCVKDELLLSLSRSSIKNTNFRKIQPVAVTATRVPIDVLSIVVNCGEDYDPDSSSSALSILIRQELWTLSDRIIEIVSGPKCGEKLCCLLDNHPLAPPLSALAASSFHFLVQEYDITQQQNQQATSRNRQRSFLVFESDEAKEALELVEEILLKHEKKYEVKIAMPQGEAVIIKTSASSSSSSSTKTYSQQQQQQHGRKLEFVVEGMSCASCARNIENTINKKYANQHDDMVPNSVSCSFAACSASVVERENLDDESRRRLAGEIQQIISGLGFKCTPLLQQNQHHQHHQKKKAYDFSNTTTNNPSSSSSLRNGENENLNIIEHDDENHDQDEDDDDDDENRLTRRAIEREEEINALTTSTVIAVAGGAPLLLMMIFMMSVDNTGGNPFYRTMHIRLIGNISFENFISLILATPVVWFSGRPFFQRAWNLFSISYSSSSGTTTTSTTTITESCSFFQSAFDFLSNSGMNMDTLVSVGVGVSYFTSLWLFVWDLFSSPDSSSSFSHSNMNFDTAAVLLAFVCVGKLLEAKAKRMTGDALISLMKLTPKTATLVRFINDDNNTQNNNSNKFTRTSIPTRNLEIGNLVEVLPGNNIPTDGVVVDGTTEVGEALVTGESLPVRKEVGSQVIGGTQNLSHPIIFRVTKIGRNTVVANILQIVRTAQQSKPTILRVTDKIAAVFVPLVLILASLVFCVWMILGMLDLYPAEWRRMVVANGNGNNMKHEGHHASSAAACSPFSFAFSFALATVVVACPCALGLAAPTAIMVGTGVGAQNGILLKSAEAMERANNVDCVVFDKTGTLTTGKMTVKKVKIHRGLLLLHHQNEKNGEFPKVSHNKNKNDDDEDGENNNNNNDSLPPVSPSTMKMISHRYEKPLPSTDSITVDEDVVTVSSIGRQHMKKKLKQANDDFDDGDLELLMNSRLLMACVAALEVKSLHPIAKAICRYSTKRMKHTKNHHHHLRQQGDSTSSSDDDDDENNNNHDNNNNDDDLHGRNTSNNNDPQTSSSEFISSVTEWTQIPGRGISANVQLARDSSWKRIAVGSLQFLQQEEKCTNAFSDEAIRVASSSTTFEPSSKKKKRVLNMMMMNAKNNIENNGEHPLTMSSSSSSSSTSSVVLTPVSPTLSSSSSDAEVVICVAVDRRFVATIHLSDTIKKDAAATISYLRQVVKAQVWMVTGDTAEAAKSVAERIGISPFKVLSNRLPDQKVEAVRLLQEHKGRKVVAFVGDGINDAGALSQANLGIAIGAGTDVAVDAADAVLVQNSLFNVCTLLDLAKTTIRRIYINFLWAVVYNLIMLPLSCGIFFWIIKRQLPPVVAGAAMMCSSLSVVGSSLMLKWYSAPKKNEDQQKQQRLQRNDETQQANFFSSFIGGFTSFFSREEGNKHNNRVLTTKKRRQRAKNNNNNDEEDDSVSLIDKN